MRFQRNSEKMLEGKNTSKTELIIGTEKSSKFLCLVKSNQNTYITFYRRITWALIWLPRLQHDK